MFVKLILVFIISYLLGSLDFGIIVSNAVYHDDVRNHGSGNAGTTNMLRTFGKKAAAMTIAGDILKGAVSVLVARFLFARAPLNLVYEETFFTPYVMLQIAIYTAVLGAVTGHMKPIFFGFKGGKGVATGFGAMLAASPVNCLIALISFAIVVLISRIVSLASITGCVVFFVVTLVRQYTAGTLGTNRANVRLFASFVLPAGVVYAHRSNIKRLLNGTEYKFTKKK